mmetsp:Transcript_28172/g.42422  ORF Transcript_28172/g.42422 Transcript_28172/m.42422 type:complete len:214 (-) Transcript_28172:307-948(-)
MHKSMTLSSSVAQRTLLIRRQARVFRILLSIFSRQVRLHLTMMVLAGLTCGFQFGLIPIATNLATVATKRNLCIKHTHNRLTVISNAVLTGLVCKFRASVSQKLKVPFSPPARRPLLVGASRMQNSFQDSLRLAILQQPRIIATMITEVFHSGNWTTTTLWALIPKKNVVNLGFRNYGLHVLGGSLHLELCLLHLLTVASTRNTVSRGIPAHV